ncbi:hypothetical protein V8E55_010286 [Tylopilus felleus]
MAPNLIHGSFQIISLTEGNPPTSVNHTKPADQSVYLRGPWEVKQEGDKSYRLSLGAYPYTGILDNKVTATTHAHQNVEWHATYREHQDAYTIAPLKDQSKGWTVHTDSGENSLVEISKIVELQSDPPMYLTSQLFQFVRE